MDKVIKLFVMIFVVGLPVLFVLTLVLTVCGVNLPWTKPF